MLVLVSSRANASIGVSEVRRTVIAKFHISLSSFTLLRSISELWQVVELYVFFFSLRKVISSFPLFDLKMPTSLLILYTMGKDLQKSSDAMFWQCWSGLRKSELLQCAEFCKHRYV